MVALYVVDAQQVAEAAELIATFGDHAPVEAAIRAGLAVGQSTSSLAP